jgi:hypothetical protein
MKKLWVLGVLLLTLNVKADGLTCLSDTGDLLNINFLRGAFWGGISSYQNNLPTQAAWLKFNGQGQYPQYGINEYLATSPTGEEVKVVVSKFESMGSCGRGSCRAPSYQDSINISLAYEDHEILFNCP